jgi:hypothetical protein
MQAQNASEKPKTSIKVAIPSLTEYINAYKLYEEIEMRLKGNVATQNGEILNKSGMGMIGMVMNQQQISAMKLQCLLSMNTIITISSSELGGNIQQSSFDVIEGGKKEAKVIPLPNKKEKSNEQKVNQSSKETDDIKNTILSHDWSIDKLKEFLVSSIKKSKKINFMILKEICIDKLTSQKIEGSIIIDRPTNMSVKDAEEWFNNIVKESYSKNEKESVKSQESTTSETTDSTLKNDTTPPSEIVVDAQTSLLSTPKIPENGFKDEAELKQYLSEVMTVGDVKNSVNGTKRLQPGQITFATKKLVIEFAKKNKWEKDKVDIFINSIKQELGFNENKSNSNETRTEDKTVSFEEAKNKMAEDLLKLNEQQFIDRIKELIKDNKINDYNLEAQLYWAKKGWDDKKIHKWISKLVNKSIEKPIEKTPEHIEIEKKFNEALKENKETIISTYPSLKNMLKKLSLKSIPSYFMDALVAAGFKKDDVKEIVEKGEASSEITVKPTEKGAVDTFNEECINKLFDGKDKEVEADIAYFYSESKKSEEELVSIFNSLKQQAEEISKITKAKIPVSESNKTLEIPDAVVIEETPNKEASNSDITDDDVIKAPKVKKAKELALQIAKQGDVSRARKLIVERYKKDNIKEGEALKNFNLLLEKNGIDTKKQ